MYKIGISGKANSGKNTLSEIIHQELDIYNHKGKDQYQIISFADPVKEIARQMFPKISRQKFYGPSKNRSYIIPNALDKNKNPLTIRQLLIDIGTDAKLYNKDIWLNNFDNTLKKAEKNNIKLVIVSDIRFKNEFNYLKNNGFYLIRLLRKDHTIINDASEMEQDEISDKEFNSIILNDSSLEDLQESVIKIKQFLTP